MYNYKDIILNYVWENVSHRTRDTTAGDPCIPMDAYF